MPLSAKKMQFCLEYLVDYNATEAILRVGSSKSKSPGITAYAWMREPEVRDTINQLKLMRAEAATLEAVDVLKELAILIKSDIKDFVNADNTIKSLLSLPSEKTRAVSSLTIQERYNQFGEQEVTTKITFWDKNSALDKLGKHFGTFEIDNAQKRPLIMVKID